MDLTVAPELYIMSHFVDILRFAVQREQEPILLII